MADVAPGGKRASSHQQSRHTTPGEQLLKMLSFLPTGPRLTTNTEDRASQKDCSLLVSFYQLNMKRKTWICCIFIVSRASKYKRAICIRNNMFPLVCLI